MKRLSFRPRPLDVNKKLSLVTSRQELDDFGRGGSSSVVKDEDSARIEPGSANSSTPAKKADGGSEIPTPQSLVVASYEQDYKRTFVQPQSYIRARPARSESGQYCEYDLHDDDENWLHKLNAKRHILPAEKFEMMLYKLELLDHLRRLQMEKERPELFSFEHGIPVPVVISKEDGVEVLERLSNSLAVLGAVFEYWKGKREILQKPILRRLQPTPAANDPNPFIVFRPRAKFHRPHTRRMQRRENDTQSFEKLRRVRHAFEQSKRIVSLLQEREKKKRELVQVESNMQRLEYSLKVGQYAQQDAMRMEDEDGSPMPSRITGIEDGQRAFFRTADHLNGNGRPISTAEMTRRIARFPPPRSRWKGGVKAPEHLEPTFLFTKPLDLGKLERAGIAATDGDLKPLASRYPGRVGRGGRLMFDRCNPLSQALAGLQNHHQYVGNMHGDEPLGRELVLLLADWLCDNYPKDSMASLIVDKTHLHLLPSMNPDGFAAQDGPIRNNAHDVDLNRDFPDQFFPQNNNEEKRQAETRAVMSWIRSTRFTASASFRGTCINYPWNGNSDISQNYATSPDDSTFKYLAGVYVDNHPLMSKSKEFVGGVTNGAAWYPLYGGMQDWNYIHGNCLELTLEMNDKKWPPPIQIPQIWDKHRKSLLELVAATVTSGVHGHVMSSKEAQPLAASIIVSSISHSMNASFEFGDYHRLLAPGQVYEVTATMTGYSSRSTSIFLPNHTAITLDFILDPLPALEEKKIVTIAQAPRKEDGRKAPAKKPGKKTPPNAKTPAKPVEKVFWKPTKISWEAMHSIDEEAGLGSLVPNRLVYVLPLISVAAVVTCLFLVSRGSYRYHTARQRLSRV